MPVNTKVLAIDLGNSTVSFGIFESGKLLHSSKFVTEKNAKNNYLEEHFRLDDSILANLAAVGLASVVPELDSEFKDYFLKKFNLEIKQITYQNCTDLQFDILEPGGVGADRIANALAAKYYYGTPALVVDVGTATSFDFVSESAAFAGGVIMPGPQISFDALKAKASKLKDIKLDWPARVLGKNTAEAINSGVHYGHLFAVEGIVRTIKEDTGNLEQVILTGGAGPLLLEKSDCFSVFDAELTLKGIELFLRD
jgi:type III pantothenate kinase